MNITRTIMAAVAVTLAALASGCATRTPMAFESDAERLTVESKPVFLMTATLKNTYHTSFQPKLLVVNVEKPNAKEAADRLNFIMDAKARSQETNSPDVGNTYLLRMPLEAGEYEIRGLTSRSFSFPISGFFFTPMHSPLKSAKPGVYYLGHVEAIVRERQGNEFRAGPPIPLIDQAASGASGGTFDVEISDRLAVDEPIFRAAFPALKGVEIQKALLPTFDRAAAQRWWEAH